MDELDDIVVMKSPPCNCAGARVFVSRRTRSACMTALAVEDHRVPRVVGAFRLDERRHAPYIGFMIPTRTE